MTRDDIDTADVASLKAAGAVALEWNCPLSAERAGRLVDFVVAGDPGTVTDVGCGRAALLRRIVMASPSVRAIGVDTDPAAISAARHAAVEAGVADRMSFHVDDAASWSDPSDTTICIGASHVFGGTQPMLDRLRVLSPTGRVVVGDGYWSARPDDWCLDTFGPLPRSLDELAELASCRLVGRASRLVVDRGMGPLRASVDRRRPGNWNTRRRCFRRSSRERVPPISGRARLRLVAPGSLSDVSPPGVRRGSRPAGRSTPGPGPSCRDRGR